MFFDLFKKKQPQEVLWATAQGEEDGQPIIYRYRMHPPAGVLIPQYPTLINIYWPFDKEANNGMPPAKENDDHIEFEDAIDSLDTPKLGFLMLVVTGNGRKEWIWYVQNEGPWLEALNDHVANHPVYPIEIQTSQDPSWSTYLQFQSGVTGV